MAWVNRGNIKGAKGDTGDAGPADWDAIPNIPLFLLDWADIDPASKQDALTTVSQAEAEAGVETINRLWTSQRVAQAIAAQSSGGTSSRNIDGGSAVSIYLPSQIINGGTASG